MLITFFYFFLCCLPNKDSFYAGLQLRESRRLWCFAMIIPVFQFFHDAARACFVTCPQFIQRTMKPLFGTKCKRYLLWPTFIEKNFRCVIATLVRIRLLSWITESIAWFLIVAISSVYYWMLETHSFHYLLYSIFQWQLPARPPLNCCCQRTSIIIITTTTMLFSLGKTELISRTEDQSTSNSPRGLD